MPEKRPVMQQAREISFAGIEPQGAHTSGLDISAAAVVPRPTGTTQGLLLVQTFDQDAYYTLDGSTPTTSNGFLLRSTDPVASIPVGATCIVTFLQAAATANLQYQWSE